MKGKGPGQWQRHACSRLPPAFSRCNQPRPQVFALACPRPVKHRSPTTLREKLIKIEAKVATHSRYVIFQMAEAAIPRCPFAAVLERIRRLGPREPVPG